MVFQLKLSMTSHMLRGMFVWVGKFAQCDAVESIAWRDPIGIILLCFQPTSAIPRL